MEHPLFRQLALSPLRSVADRHPGTDAATLDEIDEEHLKLIAQEVLTWAKKQGVTHYTFWIQPQTNETIEKHDAFFELEHLFHSGLNFKQVENFTGRVLQKGEGDGSSIPNGGLRGTEKARAYIAWDCKADIFIREGINKTLYLPAMLLTHDGEALDEKSYLRRAESKLKQSTTKILSVLGESEVKCVNYCLGIEQEFFVVRKEDYEKRLDLNQCGRSLYGQLPPRNQQFSDHYYGKLNDKMFEVLSECENELLRLGVPVKTKHKEVAVNQFEMSAYYEDAVTSVDHNMLVMDVLKSTFDRHGYTVLLHEKPFKSANGSGKHCNWSLQYSR
jgi:glutamine synthetase